jgi:riboflavin biosynthesis pyrimidine reductase
MTAIQRLYPDTQVAGDNLSLTGLYLGLNLHRAAGEGEVLIYSNYIASVDGRISHYDPDSGDYKVPESLANGRDWRLYQELAAQSDILLTSARYFRQLLKGTAQDMLPVGSRFEDLKAWRAEQGLAPQPAVAIFSRSLDVPARAIETLKERDIYLFTSDAAPMDKKEALEAQGVKVVVAGKSAVEGARLRAELIRCGFRSAYMIAGPEVHHTLIEAGVLDQMFLTTRFTLMGDENTHGLCEGTLAGPQDMELKQLYLDEQGNQLFARYAVNRKVEKG